ncbi:M24 family metallopeptidase [Paenibacillus filicis]|uniref:M24 family metallopeptidase n=1 Tax=Paenibacillus gyeongsangnamensis TaxID=3388067 RepID=A0ABT4QD72_9BACL|nr:M24 family metallopeptidase [Paenibacillus filicis]MCZ8514732.1 M24 family metallopeptidase [Paenibacillus filicis]
MGPIKEEHLKEIAARARQIMEREKLDALVASSCENFYYLSGYPSTFMYTLRMNEVALAVMLRNPDRKTVIIMNEFEAAGVPADLPGCEVRTYPTWVDVDDPFGLKGGQFQGKRPTAHQVQEMFGMLRQVLEENGISAGRVAVELNTMRYPSVTALREAAGGLELLEASPVFTELRAIKTPWEIERLRKSCAYAEAGIAETVRGIQVGSSAADIAHAYLQALMKNREGSTSRFHMISVGASFAPAHLFDTRPSEPGDLIKFDVGVDVEGYGSDIARTFVLGTPSGTVERVYNALRTGHDRILQLIEPGRTMQSVFDEVMSLIRRSGLPNYNRGHLGHSAGLSLAAEEPPFLSPAESTVFRPGMVICLETPYYGYGVGSIMIEDMVLVTEDGCERLNRLSRDLISL